MDSRDGILVTAVDSLSMTVLSWGVQCHPYPDVGWFLFICDHHVIWHMNDILTEDGTEYI